jgi:hypothetical protein
MKPGPCTHTLNDLDPVERVSGMADVELILLIPGVEGVEVEEDAPARRLVEEPEGRRSAFDTADVQ